MQGPPKRGPRERASSDRASARSSCWGSKRVRISSPLNTKRVRPLLDTLFADPEHNPCAGFAVGVRPTAVGFARAGTAPGLSAPSGGCHSLHDLKTRAAVWSGALQRVFRSSTRHSLLL